jgi:methionyl-tRNA formyltransferase
MRLVVFGSGAFGLPSFEHLAARHQILAVVSQPDRPAGRGAALTPTPVAQWAQSLASDVPLYRPQSVNHPEVSSTLRALPAEAWVVIAFGQKLGADLLTDRFAINLHASLLPRWRGAAPINAAMLAGDLVTGNSVITLADRMDAGLVLAQSSRPIEPHHTAGELHDLLASDGPALLEQVLRDYTAGTLAPRPQDDSLVTLATKLDRSLAWIDFHEPANTVRARIHALTPWPGVAVTCEGLQIKLLRVKSSPVGPDQIHRSAPGTLLDPRLGIVACGQDSALSILELQPAGKKPMMWQQFIAGRPSLAADTPLLSVVPRPSS